MGAFDTVNLNKYIWFRSDSDFDTENYKQILQFREMFVGPVYSGECVGSCVSTRCVACGFNRRVGKEYLDQEVHWLKRDIESFTGMGRPDLADKKRKNFERYFPGVFDD